jgi:hypothetical protein
MTLRLRRAAALLSALLPVLIPATAAAVPVEATHPVYALLRRLEVRGLLDRPTLGTLPLQDSDVLSMLRAAERDTLRLQTRERADLDRHLVEFDPARRVRSTRLAWRDSSTGRFLAGSASFSAAVHGSDSLPEAAGDAYAAFAPRVEGALSPTLGFSSEAVVGGEWSRHDRFFLNYDPQRGLPYNTRKRDSIADRSGSATFDAFRTVFTWSRGGVSLDGGNDWNQWGPGIFQHPSYGPHPWFWVRDSLPAVDSTGFRGTPAPGGHRMGFRSPGEAAPMTQARLGISWGRLRYVKFIAEKIGLDADEPGWVIGHRMEARLGRNVLLGLHETVIQAGRALEPTYAIPFVPLKYAEHQVGDRDNISLGADLDWRLPWSARVYGELFLDDLLGPDAFFDPYWGNKFAVTFGAEAYDLLLPASVVQAEYARVEPWLFTHRLFDNQAQHYGALLGSSLPPNSHALRLRFAKDLPRGLSAEAEYGFLQRGVDVPGSSPFDFHQDSVHGKDKVFLGDDPETRHAFRAAVTWIRDRHLQATASLGWLRVGAWRGDPSRSVSGPSASLAARIAY